MIFCLCGVPAGNQYISNLFHLVFILNSAISNWGAESVDEFYPAKRAAQSIGDHLVSVRELGSSRDGRREASRSAGRTDSAAKKWSAMTTPVTNMSLVNVSSSHVALYTACYYFHTPIVRPLTCSHLSSVPCFIPKQILQHQIQPPTVIEELEKSILFYAKHSETYAEDMADAVAEPVAVFRKNRARIERGH